MSIPLTLSNVPDATPYIQYVANGGQTVYPYPFPITQDSDLVVVINGVAQNTDSTYSLSGQGDDTGGNVTLNTGSTAGDIITLYRDIQIERLTQFAQNGGFSSSSFNAEFNNLYLIAQQLESAIGQCLQIPNTNNPAPTTTLDAAAYAGKYLSFDSNGNPTPAILTSSGSLTGAQVASLLSTVTASPPTAAQVRTSAEVAAGLNPTNFAYAPNNVKRMGVKGDGTTDDTAAIQSALNYAAFAGYTSLFFPAGQYKVTSQLTIPGVNITLYGEGLWATNINSTIVGNVGTSTAAPSVFAWNANAGGTNGQFLQVQGIRFNGNGLTGYAGSGNVFSVIGDLGVTFANFLTIRDCDFVSFKGWGASAGGTSIPAAAAYCYFADVVKFESNIVEECGQGLVIDGTLADSTQKVHVRDTTFDNLSAYGIQALYCDELLVDGQTIFNNMPVGAYLNNITSSATFFGCRFKLITAGNAIQANQALNIDQLNVWASYFYTSLQTSVFPVLSIGTNCQGVSVQGNNFLFDSTVLLGQGIEIANPSGDIGGAMAINSNRFQIAGGATVAYFIAANNATNAINSLNINWNYFGQGATPGATQSVTVAVRLTGAGGITSPTLIGNTFSMLTPGSMTTAIQMGSSVSGPVLINNTYIGNIGTQVSNSGTNMLRFEAGAITLPTINTGFGTATNSSIINNFTGTSATLAQCGGMISALVTILKTQGMLGA